MSDNVGKADALEERRLIKEFGLIVGGKDLMKLLGFRNYQSFYSACIEDRLPIPVFEILGRRGKFAKTRDVANWYLQLNK